QNNASIVARCIRSLAFAADVVVVDAESIDDTAALARAAGARVIERAWSGFAQQRRFALSQARHDWVFAVDSDEEATPELALAVAEAVAASARTPEAPAGYRIRRRNQFLGRWMDVGPWARDTQLRLFRKDAVSVVDASVHESYRVEGRVDVLSAPLHHYAHPTIAESVQRLNRYTTLEARDRASRRPVRALDPLVLPAGVFFKYYVAKGCWRAGVEGFLLAAITAMYKAVLYVKIRSIQLALAMLVALAGAACAADPALDAHTLVVGTRAEPKSLNPVAITASEAHQIAGLVFLKLLEEQDDFLSFKPQLASTWTWSADSLAVTFHLRGDALWSDGKPVTADDVRFTWEVQVDTTVAWPSASIKSKIRDVEVKDARTVVFHFKERYLYQLMDANDGVVLPKHLLGSVPRADIKTSPFGRAPVGNGPYTLARWESGQYIEFVASPRYVGAAGERAPQVRRVVFKFVPDAVTLLAQLKAGEIDLLEAVQPGDLASIRQSRPDVTVHTVPSRRMSFVAWNQKHAPFDDREVRRALTMAIDRAEIIRTVWQGYAQECTSPIVPLLWAFDPSIRAIPFDPEGARAILAGRGYKDSNGDGVLDKDGRPFQIELLVQDAQNRVDVVTLVQAHLKRIGVRVDLRVMEYNAYTERILAADYEAAFVEWKATTKVDLTGMFHTKSMRPKGFNFMSYSNPEVDRLIDEALGKTDTASARALWNRVQRLVYDDQPVTFIAAPKEITAVDDRFCNLHPNAISFFADLPRWGVKPDCPR
ncbi:MAG: ABC transporter substrate-binding protein, partial [Candidatus Latescibacteria bacterium]|nr:ABC transporter substrate-binding protein [Candidatus Latescibacterota bacterium]